MGSKWTLGRLVGEVWSGFTWLRIGIVGGLMWMWWWTFGFWHNGVSELFLWDTDKFYLVDFVFLTSGPLLGHFITWLHDYHCYFVSDINVCVVWSIHNKSRNGHFLILISTDWILGAVSFGQSLINVFHCVENSWNSLCNTNIHFETRTSSLKIPTCEVILEFLCFGQIGQIFITFYCPIWIRYEWILPYLILCF
jgi:hypothetical protein